LGRANFIKNQFSNFWHKNRNIHANKPSGNVKPAFKNFLAGQTPSQ